MNSNIKDCLTEFEKNIDKIISIFQNSQKDFFFTEKEIHSYFYHLCINSNKFLTENGFNLIHTEYPTPFKCKKDLVKHIEYVSIKEDKMRSHIDLILLNPNFVNWIFRKNLDIKYLTGLTNEVFSKYILDFAIIYERFQKEFNEPILLHAIEFKYIRHSYSGTKYPRKEILYDIAKLDLLKNKDFNINGTKIHFCFKTLSLVFVGHRIDEKFNTFFNEIEKGSCIVIQKH
jgi:hypothetical protein